MDHGKTSRRKGVEMGSKVTEKYGDVKKKTKMERREWGKQGMAGEKR